MTCPRCEDLCVRFAIRSPSDLRQAVKIAHQNIQDGTLREAAENKEESQVSFSEIAVGEAWGDTLNFRFSCSSCNEQFL